MVSTRKYPGTNYADDGTYCGPTTFQACVHSSNGLVVRVEAPSIPELWTAADIAVGHRVDHWIPEQFERSASTRTLQSKNS